MSITVDEFALPPGGAAPRMVSAAAASPREEALERALRPKLLETFCLEWPQELGREGGYGKIIRVELLHKLHDERKYDGLAALQEGIAQDCADARAWFAARHSETRRQTTRDRI